MIVLLSAPQSRSGAEGVTIRAYRPEGMNAPSGGMGLVHPGGMMTPVRPLHIVPGTASGGGGIEEAVMGLMFRPRRPLMRVAAGAATATVAYKAGQRRQQQNEYNDQAQAAYAQTQPPPAAPAPAAAAPASDSTAELERLAKLHESGALSDEEFSAAKSKLLGI
jgi:hypothetical protein